MDRILIADLPVSCRIGVPEDERAELQELRVDVELELDIRDASSTDDFEKTVPVIYDAFEDGS